MRKELTLEGDTGMLPRAETSRRAVFSPAGCILGAKACAGGVLSEQGPRTGRVCLPKYFGLEQEAAFEVTLPISLADSTLVSRVHQLDSFQMKLKSEGAL